MREIKFRGKCVADGELQGKWVYGDLVQKNGKMYITPHANVVRVNGHIGKLIVMHEVDPKTVGQFANLHDKNGQGIFEDDIVRQAYHAETRNEHLDHEWIAFDGRHIGKVVITAKGVCLKNPLHYSEDTGDTKPMNAYKQVAGYRSEVIGNIFDNPELLEVNP